MKLAAVLAAGLLQASPNFRPPPTEPMTFELSDRGSMVIARGGITRDSAERFRQFLASHPPEVRTIVLESSGGDLRGALELGREIRRQEFDTRLLRFERLPPRDLPPTGPMGETESDDDYSRRLTEALVAVNLNMSMVVGVRTLCLSACAYAFLGGVDRSLGDPDSEGLFSEPDPPEQGQLGFHPFSLNLRIEASRTGRRRAGDVVAAASQVLSTELAAYVREMGVDVAVLDFANDASLDADVAGRFSFPSPRALRETGVLIKGEFLPFELVSEQEGLALISRYSNGLSRRSQMSFLCARRAGASDRLMFLVTTARARRRQPGPSPRVRFVLPHGPSPQLIQGMTIGGGLIHMDVSADRQTLQTAGSRETFYSGTRQAESQASLSLFLPILDEISEYRHAALTLTDEAVSALSTARELGVSNFDGFNLMSVRVSLDDSFREAVPLLLRNCVSLVILPAPTAARP